MQYIGQCIWSWLGAQASGLDARRGADQRQATRTDGLQRLLWNTRRFCQISATQWHRETRVLLILTPFVSVDDIVTYVNVALKVPSTDNRIIRSAPCPFHSTLIGRRRKWPFVYSWPWVWARHHWSIHMVIHMSSLFLDSPSNTKWHCDVYRLWISVFPT
jgi:hypothetical protein